MVTANHDVLRFDVAMYDAYFVRGGECRSHLDGNIENGG